MNHQTDIKYWYLRDHQFFRVLSNSQVKQLCIISKFKKAQKGEIIYLPYDGQDKIYFLKKGNIKIVEIDDNGNEVIKDILMKGDIFGELSLNNEGPSNEEAVALTSEVLICSFLLSDFEQLMTQYPHLAMSYTKFVGFQLKRVKNNYSNLMFKDAKSRLIHFFKEWAMREGRKNEDSYVLNNYLTQSEIAQIICTSRQTATQLINELEANKALVYGRKEIILNDLSLFQIQ
jgi:CRP/FNR family transcriptional regulator